MTKSAWERYKEKNGITPLDILNPMTRKVSDDISSQRLEICKTCPNLIELTMQCKKCGCFMNAKAKYEAAKCPIGKW
jgi:hypothetical protein